MHKVKFILKNLFYAVYGGISSFYTPVFLSIAFNFSHGIANNPDGILSIPFGIVLLFVILVIDIIIIIKSIKSNNVSKFKKTLTVLIFVATKIIGIFLAQSDWQHFMYCLSWYLQFGW